MSLYELISGCGGREVIAAEQESDVEAESQTLVIGGREYTLPELQGWDLDRLARLIMDYQETRRAWLRADEAIAVRMAALEAELAAAKSELGRVRAVRRRARGRGAGTV